jgi:hypothetical protein
LEGKIEKTYTTSFIDFCSPMADFVIYGNVIVEMIGLIIIEVFNLAQAKNYILAYDYPIVLLINFGSTNLQLKNVLN